MKKITYVIQGYGIIKSISECSLCGSCTWYDVDKKEDKKDAIISWKEFKKKLPKVRLIERTLTEKRIR